jgi:hypothetical protein
LFSFAASSLRGLLLQKQRHEALPIMRLERGLERCEDACEQKTGLSLSDVVVIEIFGCHQTFAFPAIQIFLVIS